MLIEIPLVFPRNIIRSRQSKPKLQSPIGIYPIFAHSLINWITLYNIKLSDIAKRKRSDYKWGWEHGRVTSKCDIWTEVSFICFLTLYNVIQLISKGDYLSFT